MSIDDRGHRAAHHLHHRVRDDLDSGAALDATLDAPSRRFGTPRLLVAAVLVAVLGGAGALVALDPGDGGEQVSVADQGPEGDGPPPSPVDPTVPDPPPVPEDLGRPVSVEPSTDLQPGQEVTVTGEGFTPGRDVGVVMCALTGSEGGGDEGTVDLSACDFGDYVYATPDAAGRVTATWPVPRLVTTAHAGTVDCARPDVLCGVVIGQLDDYGVWGGAPVSFADGLPPLERPTLSVTPTTGLRHGDVVTVSGTGFAGEVHNVSLCRVGDRPAAGPFAPGACWFLWARHVDDPPLVGADGSFSVEVPVWRTVPVMAPDGDGTESTAVDCAVERCAVTVTAVDSLDADAVTVAFDPDGPRPEAPTLSVSPTEGLRPGDPITVVVTGLAPGATAVVGACGAVTPQGRCAAMPPMPALDAVVQADGTGRAEATLSAPDPGTYATCPPDDPCGLVAVVRGEDGEPTPASPAVPITYAP